MLHYPHFNRSAHIIVQIKKAGLISLAENPYTVIIPILFSNPEQIITLSVYHFS